MTRKEYNISVKEYSGRLYGYAIKWLRNEHDANDLVQDVYGKLWQFRKKVSNDKVKSWLFTAMHNALVNFTKKKKALFIEDVTYTEPLARNHDYDLEDLIEKSLSSLPKVQRSIIILRDQEGYNYAEIGEILELKESQVKVYLFRARQKVKNQLKDLTVLVA